jgi:hypothetical protein
MPAAGLSAPALAENTAGPSPIPWVVHLVVKLIWQRILVARHAEYGPRWARRLGAQLQAHDGHAGDPPSSPGRTLRKLTDPNGSRPLTIARRTDWRGWPHRRAAKAVRFETVRGPSCFAKDERLVALLDVRRLLLTKGDHQDGVLLLHFPDQAVVTGIRLLTRVKPTSSLAASFSDFDPIGTFSDRGPNSLAN